MLSSALPVVGGGLPMHPTNHTPHRFSPCLAQVAQTCIAQGLCRHPPPATRHHSNTGASGTRMARPPVGFRWPPLVGLRGPLACAPHVLSKLPAPPYKRGGRHPGPPPARVISVGTTAGAIATLVAVQSPPWGGGQTIRMAFRVVSQFMHTNVVQSMSELGALQHSIMGTSGFGESLHPSLMPFAELKRKAFQVIRHMSLHCLRTARRGGSGAHRSRSPARTLAVLFLPP